METSKASIGPARRRFPYPWSPSHPDADSVATGINGDGVVCGYSVRSVPRLDEFGEPVLDQYGNPVIDYQMRPLVWRVHDAGVFGPIELSTPEFAIASAISENDGNGRADVVGSFRDKACDATASVRWSVIAENDGTLTVSAGPEVLGVLAYADGVNNSGQPAAPTGRSMGWGKPSFGRATRNRSCSSSGGFTRRMLSTSMTTV